MWPFKPKPKFKPECYTLAWPLAMQWAWQFVDRPEQVLRRSQVYLVPVNPSYVMRSIDLSGFETIKERRDCNGFNDMFFGKLAEWGYGNMLCADISAQIKGQDASHALVGFKQGDRLILGDTKLGRIIEPEIVKINFMIL